MTAHGSTGAGDGCERLESYLRRRAAEGEFYFKSRGIADDVGLTPKQLGARLAQLRETDGDLHLEKWAYTGATTWRAVLRAGEA